MQAFFELVAGEPLTLEALSYYLPYFQGYQQHVSPSPRFTMVTSFAQVPPDADTALAGLQRHLDDLRVAVYTSLAQTETSAQRRERIDAEMAWFNTPNQPDRIGLKLEHALQALGLKHDDLLQLLLQELTFDDAALNQAFGDGDRVYTALRAAQLAERLFDTEAATMFGLPKADLDLAREWVRKHSRTPFQRGEQPLNSAMSSAEGRAFHMSTLAYSIGHADTLRRSYAASQISFVDAR